MRPYDDNPLFALLDHRIPLGVLALDRQAIVITRNWIARTILEERDGVSVVRGRLTASAPEAAFELNRLVTAACADGATSASAVGILHLARTAPRAPLTLLVTPLRWAHGESTEPRPAALVFLTDPDREPQQLEQTLERLYGFTRSEADVAMLVLDGARVGDVARQRGTSINTARTHLKRVLGKVGVQSQADLVRHLLAGPGAVTAFRPGEDVPRRVAR